MSIKQKLYHIHNLINEEKFKSAEEILENNYNELIKNSRSYYSLLVKTKIKLNKIDEVYNILIGNKIMKKIDYLTYIENCKNKDKINKIFYKFMSNYRLTAKEIDFMIDKKLYFILKKLDGYHVSTSYKGDFKKYTELKLYKVEDNSTKSLIDIFSENIKNKKYLEKLKNKIILNNYKVIIDFGNIIYRFSNTNKFDKEHLKYEYIFKFLNNIKIKYGEPLLISSKKHFKKVEDDKTNNLIKLIKKSFKNNIFYSSYGEDDDNFIILASLITNKSIITRDRFKNHLMKFKETDKLYDIFKIYITQKTFDHYIISKKRINKSIKNYCIQVFQNNILIPTEQKKFLKIELIKNNLNTRLNNYSSISFYLILIFYILIIYLLFLKYKYIKDYLYLLLQEL